MSTISRRRALSGAATAGLGLPILAACGDDGDGGASGTSADPTSSSATAKPRKPGSSNAGDASSAPAGEGLATSDVPVGGGIIVDETVITQPTQGDFKAFSAVCTHQGCLVGGVSDGFIVCPCHGSRFAIDTGEPTSDSEARAPLPAVGVAVTGGRITVG